MKRRMFCFVMTLVMLITVISFSKNDAEASDYPLLVPALWEQTVTIGETANIEYDYFPAFKNEKIEVTVYNSQGKAVASCSHDFYNTSANIQKYTVTWDTRGKAPGEYKVVAVKKFYSLYRWNTAPTDLTTKLILVNPHVHSFVNYTVTTPATYFSPGVKTYICSCGETKVEEIPALNLLKCTVSKVKSRKKGFSINWYKVTGASGYEIEYSTKKSFSGSRIILINNANRNTKTITKLKKKKKYYVRIRAYVTDGSNIKYSAWSKKTIKTK